MKVEVVIPKNTCIYCAIVRKQKMIDDAYCEKRKELKGCWLMYKENIPESSNDLFKDVT